MKQVPLSTQPINQNLKQSLLVAVLLAIISLSAWEIYWRNQGRFPTINDDQALWASHRAEVETATKNDVVILGASRAFFDFQLQEFKEVTGIKPIQLSSTGSSPLPTFHDIVHNTEFQGTIIVGVTPKIFFSTTLPESFSWEKPISTIDFYQKRTYAQRINHKLSLPLQQNLVFMSADDEEWSDDIDLRSLLKRIQLPRRTDNPQMPPFYFFGGVDAERNMTMTERTATDTAFANTVIEAWKFFGSFPNTPEKEATMAFFLTDLQKFKARGGTVVLVRCPSSGGLRAAEKEGTPRAEFWDDLVAQAQVPSYHFEDYEQLKNLTCPEWSHLSKEDAEYFTREIAKMMLKDNAIAKGKGN